MTANAELQRVNEWAWLRGFSNLLRKESRAWWGTRRWWINALLWTGILGGLTGLMLFIFAYAIPMVGIYALRFVSVETRDAFFQPIFSEEVGLIVLATSALLIILNIGLFAITQVRFQRTRLISNP